MKALVLVPILALCLATLPLVARQNPPPVASSGWDGGGSIPAAIRNVAGSIQTPGLVVGTGNGAGWTIVARGPTGAVVDVTQTDGDGVFVITTGQWLSYTVDVVGTPVAGFPFEPGAPILVVIP